MANFTRVLRRQTIGEFNNVIGYRKVGCHPCTLVGIAKHLNTRTDRQPTIYELSPCLVYSLFNLAISQEVRHFSVISNFVPKDNAKVQIFLQ